MDDAELQSARYRLNIPSFRRWVVPPMVLWAFASVCALLLYPEDIFGAPHDLGFANTRTSFLQHGSSVILVWMILAPIVGGIYMTVFISGICYFGLNKNSYDYKNGLIYTFFCLGVGILSAFLLYLFSFSVFLGAGFVINVPFVILDFVMRKVEMATLHDIEWLDYILLSATFVAAAILGTLIWALWMLFIQAIIVGEKYGNPRIWIRTQFKGGILSLIVWFLAVLTIAVMPSWYGLCLAIVLYICLPLPHLVICHRFLVEKIVPSGYLPSSLMISRRLIVICGFSWMISFGLLYYFEILIF